MNRIQTSEEYFRELGPLEAKREVPGLLPVDYREVRYVEDRGEEPFKELFERVIWHVDPPLMKDGGALIEGCVVTSPTGRRFQALSYRGDIEGWRQQVVQGAAAVGVSLGQLVDRVLVLDDGTSHPLADCQIEFN